MVFIHHSSFLIKYRVGDVLVVVALDGELQSFAAVAGGVVGVVEQEPALALGDEAHQHGLHRRDGVAVGVHLPRAVAVERVVARQEVLGGFRVEGHALVDGVLIGVAYEMEAPQVAVGAVVAESKLGVKVIVTRGSNTVHLQTQYDGFRSAEDVANTAFQFV